MKRTLPIILILLALAAACGPSRHLRELRSLGGGADIAVSDDYAYVPDSISPGLTERRDTFQVIDIDGREMLIMNAIADESGEMVAHDVINAAVVTSRFRNIAERHGKIDLKFDINVPPSMMDSRWQLRLYPRMTLLGEESELEPIVITGKDYRKDQLRGYMLYEKYISSIITDTTVFVRRHLLETFIKREIPALAALKDNQDYVDPEQFASALGVSGRMAIDHYTNMLRKRHNQRRKERAPQMFDKFVKVPISTAGLRLDTVMANPDGGFTYCYVQTIDTRPRLKKADISLCGEIFEGASRIYSIPRSEDISFYISSLSAFLDPSERYVTTVVSRSVEANSACWIDFSSGSSEIDESLSENRGEISRIKRNLRELLANESFDMDSITVLASCSPEGSYSSNERLAASRAASVTGYFRSYLGHLRDSVRAEEGIRIDLDGTWASPKASQITFKASSRPENWVPLDSLVRRDSLLSPAQKEEYFALREGGGDPDSQERAMQGKDWYRRLREVFYPRLRTVEFTFYLHRRGMVKDTVHTTVLDTAYMRGVDAIRDRDYEKAISVLRPYHPDFNLAVAYLAMDYNASAEDILSSMPEDDKVDYMLALLYARKGDDRNAVEKYLRSVSLNPGHVYRGNLDPEISALIKKYRLNRQDDNI